MCRRRRNILALEPRPAAMRQPASHNTSATIQTTTTNNNATSSSSSSSASATTTSSATTSSSISTHQLSLSISKNPTLYPFTDISAATNNFLSKRLPSSSSSAWRCNLRGKDVVIFQRAYRGDPVNLPSRLSALCKSHHSSLIKLLGASVGGGYIYLVYQYTAGASLEDCLRNPRNPNFTPLSKWISRMQIAADLAQGLDYIHVHCNTIHNRIKSSSIVVTEPFFNAMICHFGAADLAHEIPAVPPPPPPPPPVSEREKVDKRTEEEIEEVEEKEKEKENEKDQDDEVSESSRKMMMRRSKSNGGRFEGTRGYIAPEVIAGGGRLISQKSDVFAFGVVVLELISGREPLKYRMKKNSGGEYETISLIDTARDAIGMMEDEEGVSEMEVEERRGRIRQWVDRRLRDSFPVEVVEKLMRVVLRCVEEEAFMRPDMTWVAGKVSKLFLDSKVWDDNVRVPADFSVTYGPR